MLIKYVDNPLMTSYELTQEEKLQFWFAIKEGEVSSIMTRGSMAFDNLARGDRFEDQRFYVEGFQEGYDSSLSEADGEVPLNKEVQRLYDVLLPELMYGRHVGDCTAIAGTCTKCLAEERVNHYSFYFSKAMGWYLLDLFRPNDDGESLSIDAAIQKVEDQFDAMGSRRPGKTTNRDVFNLLQEHKKAVGTEETVTPVIVRGMRL